MDNEKKESMKQKRSAKRKPVTDISISNLTSLGDFEAIATWGNIVDVSSSGFLIHLERQDIVPKDLRQNLSLEELEGLDVSLIINPMELEVSGNITRTKYIGKGVFEIAVDFSMDAPEYWRDCLYDLIPGSHESMYSEEE